MVKAVAERRRGRRIAADNEVNVRHMRRQVPGRARDISEGGIFLFTEEKLAPGAELELVLMMPPEAELLGGRWVSCYATVVRVEEPARGREFGVAARIDYCEAVAMI